MLPKKNINETNDFKRIEKRVKEHDDSKSINNWGEEF